MAAASTSPPLSPSPNVDNRDPMSLRGFPSASTTGGHISREPLDSPSLEAVSAHLSDAPVSPRRVNLQGKSWPQPSNANVEHTTPHAEQFGDPASTYAYEFNATVEQSRHLESPLPKLPPTTVASVPSDVDALAVEFSRGSLDPNLPVISRTDQQHYTEPMMTTVASHDRPPGRGVARTRRESDNTVSTSQRQPSAQSSAATSASSVYGANDPSDCLSNGEFSESSLTEGSSFKNMPVPLFQYHHQQHEYPPAVASGAAGQVPRSTSSDFLESGASIRRHLSPNSAFLQRTSLIRPKSSYSTLSDYSSRGRSPILGPGNSHMRAPSVQSRKSPDARSSSYAELLNLPYPQQAPAPLSLDNSNLRTVVGNNASLLSTQKTLEMYRQNVRKTTDSSIQYSFAVFLISTAQEQGLDVSDPKATKKQAPQPLRDLESPVVEGSVASPYELVREARQILQRLANAGYPFAQYYLADGYASGLFSKGKEDYNAAFPLFVLAAKHGHAESAYRTALCYEFGWGPRKDPARAVQYLRSAAAKRHPGAMTRLGKACLSGDLGEKRYREGIKWMKLASEAADSQYNAAPYQLGCLYETGYGDDIFADASYAAELFTQAADLGHPEASYRMGDAYEQGRLNCPRDPALSVHFYTGAAERGHAAAMMGLCAWYMVGAPPILEKDEEEAYEWARRSAELGNVKAQYAVGYFTEMGIGCRRDMLEANVWYVRAADAGDERAKQRIAAIQAAVSGEGTPMEVGPPRGKKGGKDDKDCVVM